MNDNVIEFQSPGEVRMAIAADVPIVQLLRGLATVGLCVSNRRNGGLVIHRATGPQIAGRIRYRPDGDRSR